MGENIGTALASGLVAALVSGAFQLIARRLDSATRRDELFNSRKIDQYYKALDAYAALMESLRELGRSLSGRKGLGDCGSDVEKAEMIARDQRGADAIGGVFAALKSARCATLRLDLLGSKRAMDDYKKIDELIERYGQELLDDALTTGVFRAAKLRALIDDADSAFEELMEHARNDLGCHDA